MRYLILFAIMFFSAIGCVPEPRSIPSDAPKLMAIRKHQASIRTSIAEINESIDIVVTQGPEAKRRFRGIAYETEGMLMAFLDAVQHEEPLHRDPSLERECKELLERIRSIDWSE